MGWVTKLGPGRCRFLLPELSRFSQIGHIIFRAVVALKTTVPYACRFVACSSIVKVCQTDTQTDRPSTVTLAAHARRGLMRCSFFSAGSLAHQCLAPIIHHLVASVRKPAAYDAQTEKLLMTRNIHASAHAVGRSHTHASVRVCAQRRGWTQSRDVDDN